VVAHHIIPRSCGGTDDPKNIVYLTPKEHYIVHHLLMFVYPIGPHHNAMVSAHRLMAGLQKSQKDVYGNIKITARHYEELVREFGRSHSEALKQMYIEHPEKKEQHSRKLKNFYEDPENRKKMSNQVKQNYINDPTLNLRIG